MQIIINAENASGLKVKLIDICKTFNIETDDKQIPLPLTPPSEVKNEKPAKAKKEKVEKEAAPTANFLDTPVQTASAEVSKPAAAAVSNTVPVPTKEMLTKATEEVVGKHKLQAAIDLLAKFGAARLSLLKEEHFAAYYAECQKLLA